MKDNRIGFDEAVELIMKRTGKNRRQAKASLLEKLREGKLASFTNRSGDPDDIIQIPKEHWPPTTKELVEQFSDDPSLLYLPLTVFLKGLTPAELHGELRSGRLRARTSKEVLKAAKNPVNPADFSVDLRAVAEWMADPETPPDLLEKFKAAIDREPH